MNHTATSTQPWRRVGASLLLAATVALSWTQFLDRAALTDTGVTLQRALATFATARALNGVISVAQGTELAVQPVGVGVTLTVGEVLDPLNDLVEQFSWLALLACVSLGTQLLLAEAVVGPWMNGALSAAAAAALVALWTPRPGAMRTAALRAFTLLLFARFLFPLIALATAWADQSLLAERQEASLREIETAQVQIESLQTNPPGPTDPAVDPPEPSMLDRLGALLDEQAQALDIRPRLDAVTARVESAIEQLVNLIVIFTVQTIVVPVAALLAGYWAFVWLWRWCLS